MTSGETDEILNVFLAESRENLEALYRGLVALDGDPDDRAALDAIFRCVHTIKATAGFLGFHRVVALTHSAESLLADLRDGLVEWTPATAAIMFHTAEAVRAALRDAGPGWDGPEGDDPGGGDGGGPSTVGSAWSGLSRLVQDLASACGKDVVVETDGATTPVDRAVAEALADPLAHLVRNAVDHGAETPDERVRVGKAPQARLWLRARREGDRVHLEVADDGAGIDLDRVRAVAADLPGGPGRPRSDEDLLGLLFLPGFTTAAEVTDISGRGVGLDVVRSGVERLGGTVRVRSRRGAGTTFHLCVPVTAPPASLAPPPAGTDAARR